MIFKYVNKQINAKHIIKITIKPIIDKCKPRTTTKISNGQDVNPLVTADCRHNAKLKFKVNQIDSCICLNDFVILVRTHERPGLMKLMNLNAAYGPFYNSITLVYYTAKFTAFINFGGNLERYRRLI